MTSRVLTKVAWRKSASLYNFGPPSKIHYLEGESTRALCGALVPKQARPGYEKPSGQHWLDVHCIALDVNDEEDFYVEKTGRNERAECRKCAVRLTPDEVLAG